jgi:hypothetical protein
MVYNLGPKEYQYLDLSELEQVLPKATSDSLRN